MLQDLTEKDHRKTRPDSTSPWFNTIRLAVGVGIAYFFAAQVSLAVIAKSDGLALFWLAGGVSSGVLIALGCDARLPVASATIIATIIVHLMNGRNIWVAAAFALCNVSETLVTAWLIERYFGSGFSLGRLRNVLGLLAVSVVATAASGIGATMAYKLLQNATAPIWITWAHWFGSGAIGIITVAPLVIGLAAAAREPPRHSEIIEGVAALVALAAVMTATIVWQPSEPWEPVAPVALLFPFLLWLAARCQPVFAAAAAFIVSLTIVWTTSIGIGHFGDPALPIGDRIPGIQEAILGFTLCAHILAALFSERRQAEARLQEALAVGGVMAFVCNPSNGIVQRSENAAQILGLGPQQTLTAAQFLAGIHPDDLAGFKAHNNRDNINSLATVCFRFIRPDSQEVWLEETSRAEFDTTGRLVRIHGLTRDITRHKQSEKHKALLSAELDHRVKNVLARVAAVVMHTRRRCETMDEFVKALHGRIQSIAAAHALLSQSRWYGVGLTDLMRHQLAPYTTNANTAISGPDIILTSAETQAVAMVIHELVTNAAKHGALSSSNGRVSVSWDRTGADAAATLKITWRELGGPPITTSVQSGYGLTLIRDLIPHELGGTVDLAFQTDGLCCKIEIPIKEVDWNIGTN